MHIKLTFLGAARNVTGSRYLLEANGSRLLVDCGLYQERDLRSRNWDPFPVPAESIQAVLLTHAHLDHCGLLPKLVREGFAGRIYGTAATADLARIILLDAAKLQEEDALFKLKRHEREGRTGPHPEEPLYVGRHAEMVFPLFEPVEYRRPFQPLAGVTATYHDAGHILGAAMIRLELQANGERRTLLFSGDLGCWDRPLLNDPSLPDEADYVLIESTYGNRLHEREGSLEDQLGRIVNGAREAGGNIVIPSFAVERTQEVLYHFRRLLEDNRIPHLMVFLDSPMAISVNEVFRRHSGLLDEDARRMVDRGDFPWDVPGLSLTRSVDESKAINHIRGTAAIIAGSGMCTGGRIKHHLVNNIARPESTILFVGYQAQGTLGRIIVEGAREVRILGQTHPVKARVEKLNGLSGHADQAELMKWISALRKPPRRVFVTHGEPEAAEILAGRIRDQMPCPVDIPAYREMAELN
jgi:metallo-beta-lactamase family protein